MRRLWYAVVICAAAWCTATFAQQPRPRSAPATWKVPRTPWGDPDLQGIWTNVAEAQTPLERPAAMGTRDTLTNGEWQARLAATRKQFEELAMRGVDSAVPSRQASRIVDPPNGRFPPLTAEGQRRVAAARGAWARMDGPEDAPLYTRCLTRGVLSMLPTQSNMFYQIVQSPGWVAILYEQVRDVRLIPVNAPGAVASAKAAAHVENGIRQWMGDPRGTWDGDTLIVETTNFRDGTMDAGFFASDALHVVERFRRVSRSEIKWEATVTDPKVYTAPITVALPLHNEPVPDQIFEYACHEGNRPMEVILSAARTRDRGAR